MKKKIISYVLALAMVLMLFPTFAFAAANFTLTVTADKANPSVGETVVFTVTINATDDAANYGGFQFDLDIPSGLSYVDGSGKIIDGAAAAIGADADCSFTVTADAKRVIVASADGLSNLSNQKLLTFSCTVDEGASGEKTMTLSNVEVNDKSYNTVEHAITPATVNIAAAPTTCTVTITPGANMTLKSGSTSQTIPKNNIISPIYFTADEGYYFPDDYTVAEQNGVWVERVSKDEIKVTSTNVTGDVNITLPDATAKPAPTTYSVKINLGNGISISSSVTGNSTQTVTIGDPITPVEFVASEDYYFPTDYGYTEGDFTIAREGYTKIKVSGTPTSDVEFTLKDATKKATGPAAPDVGHTDCTTNANNDGTITGVNNNMEYRKGSETLWSQVTGSDGVIKGLVPGTYEVRYAATTTVKAGTSKTVVIKGYDPDVEMFTITFNPNGGKGDTKVVTVRKGDNYVIQNEAAYGIAAQDGMRFVYWSDKEDNGQGSEHYPAGREYRNVQSNLTFYAVWETTDRTVQFDANGGTGTMNAVTATYGQQYTLPPCTFTAPEGKEFDCWKPDVGQGTYKPGDSYPITGNVKFVAQWKDKQGGGEQQGFTLIFQPGEGSGRDHVVNDINTQQYTLPNVPDTFTAPAGKPIFDGWKAEGGNVVYPAGTVIPVNADATFVAQWRADGPQGDTVLVTFKPGDGKGDEFDKRVPAGDSFRLPAKPADFKAPAGKVFAGWKIEDPQGNLNEKLYKAGHKFDLTEDVTFVAQWKARPYYGDDTTPDADPMVNPGTGAAPVGAPIAVVIAVAVAGAAYFVTTKKR